jgi:hypothetical protein
MRSIITIFVILFSITSNATEKWPVWSQIQHANKSLGWVVDQNNIIGNRSRVHLHGGQDPFPFCAAVAASILHDQHECMTSGGDCSQQVRTSALSVVDASQGTPGKINFDNGGNTILALQKIIKNGGAASHDSCNYSSIKEPRKPKGIDFVRIYGVYSGYRQTRNYDGYLQRYYRDEFHWEISTLGINRQGLDSILTQNFNFTHDLFTSVLLNEECNRVDVLSSKKYVVHNRDNPDQDITLSYTTIVDLLRHGVPVGINLCLNIDVGLKTCNKHSLVIFAEAKATNTITGDVRRVFRIANTWSEGWHRDHTDGWVFADQLMLGIYSLFWLE